MVPPRTTSDLVKGLLLDDFGNKLDGVSPDLTPYIATASTIVDRVMTCAINKGLALSNGELELIERWLSAHFYQQADPGYQSRNTLSASGQFTGKTEMGFESTRYGQQALLLDYSNCLRNIQKQQRAGMVWLGKPPSQQIPYVARN